MIRNMLKDQYRYERGDRQLAHFLKSRPDLVWPDIKQKVAEAEVDWPMRMLGYANIPIKYAVEHGWVSPEFRKVRGVISTEIARYAYGLRLVDGRNMIDFMAGAFSNTATGVPQMVVRVDQATVLPKIERNFSMGSGVEINRKHEAVCAWAYAGKTMGGEIDELVRVDWNEQELLMTRWNREGDEIKITTWPQQGCFEEIDLEQMESSGWCVKELSKMSAGSAERIIGCVMYNDFLDQVKGLGYKERVALVCQTIGGK